MGGVLAGGCVGRGPGVYPLRRFRFGSGTGSTSRAAAVGVGTRVPGGSAISCGIFLRPLVGDGGAPMITAPARDVCAV